MEIINLINPFIILFHINIDDKISCLIISSFTRLVLCETRHEAMKIDR
jgi:hypothetical protein